MNSKPTLKKMQAECDAFNSANPVGSKVTVKLDGQSGLFETVTLTEAQILNGNSPVIWLENIRGCYLLNRVKPLIEVNIESKQVPLLVFSGIKSLDPIRVVLEDFKPGEGRILIVCYTRAWTGYWGGMSGQTISQFFTSCNAGYLLGNLAAGQRNTKQEDAYLIRIIEAVQAGLRQQAKDGAA